MHLRGRIPSRKRKSLVMDHPILPYLCTLFLGIAQTDLCAQTDGDTLLGSLDTVQVMATRISGTLMHTGRQLQVLDHRLLTHAPAPSLSEVLRAHTLVDVRQRGPFDVQTDLGLRGGTFEQTLVLLDGIPLSDPQTGHHAMNLPLNADALERVEVLYGGASRTFGAGAFSGAVNLISRAPQGTRGSLVMEGGSHGSYRAQLAQDLSYDHGGVRISAQVGHSDGHVPNSDFDQRSMYLGGTHRFRRLVLKGQLGTGNKRFGAQNFYSSTYPDQQEITGLLMAALELRNDASSWTWSVRTYHRQHDDRFQLFRESEGYYRYDEGYFIRSETDTARFTPTFFYTFHNRHRTNVSGAEANLKRSWKAGTTAVGVHLRDERIQSNVLGKPLDEPRTVGSAREAFTRADDRQNLAMHLDHRYVHGRWGVDAGVLLNLNSAFAPEWAPGVDLHHRWNPAHTTYTNVGRAFRLPTWTDLYYSRGGAQGSLTLKPEHADQVELGHRVTHLRWTASAALWRRAGDDLIDWVQFPGETVVRAANLTEVNMNGVELMATYRTANAKGRGGAGYTHQWTDQQEFPFTSLYVLDHLSDVALIWWQQQVRQRWSARLNASWRVRNGSYRRQLDGSEQGYPSPLRVDARIDHAWRQVSLFAAVNNLLDVPQVDRGEVPLPGRWLSAGVELRWRQ
jgi:iron complex outermembrane receptor protein